MTATSHAAWGAAIGLVIKEPAIALPLAFVSHFILDGLPHIGLDELGGHLKNKTLFHKVLIVDATLLISFLLFLLGSGASLLVFACVFLAGSPDFVWAYRYVFQERLGRSRQRAKNAFSRFHSKIQWSQTLKGAYVEVPLTLSALIFITANL